MAKEKVKLGIGGIMYDAGSSVKNKTGNWRVFRPIVTEKCTGCGRCVQFCPEGAIKLMKIGGKMRAVIDYNYCKGCMICAAECPVKAIIKVQEKR
jgi:pyruvate ferredoxin oxidoreductase delta subunit